VRELVDWRLAEYLSRSTFDGSEEKQFLCKVSRSGDRAILVLPDRSTHPEIPTDWVPLEANGQSYEANFVKLAVNVMRVPGEGTNILHTTLTEWFGPDAGRPGSNYQVVFEPTDEGYRMRPANERSMVAPPAGPELWNTYSREQIPPMFGLTFSKAIWNAGFVAVGQQVFLLVTLEKKDLPDNHNYEDRFLRLDRFEWKSQNRTAQRSKHGQMLRHHSEKNLTVHLFIRRSKKIRQKAAPFYYCGPVRFEDWQGEKPITIIWKLSTPVPERLQQLFLIQEN
jgi:hypothetical protein